MAEGGGRFKSRVAALRERGFDVESPTGEMASEQMLRLEEQADYAAKVRTKVLDLPEHRDADRRRFLSQLSDPNEAAAVEIELSGLLRRHRPWVIIAERSRVKWSDEGRSLELTHILERLDAVDDEIVLGSPRLLSMIEDVSPMREIEPILAEIERRQVRRFEALEGMVDMLNRRGWEVSGIKTGTMHEQFSEAERIHSLDGQLTQCQRQIENEIRPFGHNIAERLWGAVTLAQKEASGVAMNEVKTEVQGAADDLARRHALVEGRIAEWQSEGFQVPAKLPLLAGEMIAWESKLPKIAEQIEATHGIWGQMEAHLEQWPEYRKLANRTRGHLNAIQALDVLLQGLRAKTEGAHAACTSRLETWSSYGIEISPWSSLIDNEPRAILEELDAHQPFIDIVIPLIEGLQTLDTSVSGELEVENWLKQLRSASSGMEVVEVAQDWLDLATNRAVRHRDYLDRARLDLATLWPEEIDSSTLNLALYEATVSNLESGEDLPSSLNIPKKAVEVDERLNQVIGGLRSELDEWRHLGWSVEGLEELLSQDPVRLGLDLPDIRRGMESHDARIARLEPLPWALDVELAERVLSDLMRPERLVALDAEYQELMLALSNAEGEGDPDFEFKPFKPQMPMLRVEEELPVLAPVIEEVVEEVEVVIDEDVESVVKEVVEEVFEEVVEEESESPITGGTVIDAWKRPKDETRMWRLWSDILDEDIALDFEPLEIPLDVRVQRLIRLSLVVIHSPEEVFHAHWNKLVAIGKKLQAWTTDRLARRHAPIVGSLIWDAKTLGERLAEIPGPGATIPLSKDVFALPDSDDSEGIGAAIKRLEKSVMLPSAMMKIPEPVES